MFRISLENVLSLEQPLLKVPYDQLKRHQRNKQRYCEKEFAQHEKTLKKLGREAMQSGNAAASVDKPLDGMLKRLGQLRRKLVEIDREQQRVEERIQQRMQHLQLLCATEYYESPEWQEWSAVKVNRAIADYLLREGWSTTADTLLQSPELAALVDSGLFDQSLTISRALLEGSLSEALKWCADNRNGLRKIRSTLEFELHLQTIIEMARQRQTLEAISYARQHIHSYIVDWGSAGAMGAETSGDMMAMQQDDDDNYRNRYRLTAQANAEQTPTDAEDDSQSTMQRAMLLQQLQRAMTLLAFPPDVALPQYAAYYSKDRWLFLRKQFLAAHVELHSLPLRSLLSVALQTGLSALKTMSCATTIDHRASSGGGASVGPAAEGGRAAACPACTTPLDAITARLPRAHHDHSSIICRISGRLLGGSELAGCGPNGHVYSQQALESLAALHQGQIRCPITHTQFALSDVKRVFIL